LAPAFLTSSRKEQLTRDGWKPGERTKIGRGGKMQLNLYDPDDTRVEFMNHTRAKTLLFGLHRAPSRDPNNDLPLFPQPLSLGPPTLLADLPCCGVLFPARSSRPSLDKPSKPSTRHHRLRLHS